MKPLTDFPDLDAYHDYIVGMAGPMAAMSPMSGASQVYTSGPFKGQTADQVSQWALREGRRAGLQSRSQSAAVQPAPKNGMAGYDQVPAGGGAFKYVKAPQTAPPAANASPGRPRYSINKQTYPPIVEPVSPGAGAAVQPKLATSPPATSDVASQATAAVQSGLQTGANPAAAVVPDISRPEMAKATRSPAMINGVKAGDWFQQAADRQQRDNKFATARSPQTKLAAVKPKPRSASIPGAVFTDQGGKKMIW